MNYHTGSRLTRDRRGTLLLEVLLALVIMSISLGVIIQSMTASMRGARYAAQYTQAAMAADAEMSRLLKDSRIPDPGGAGRPDGGNVEPGIFTFTVDSAASPESNDLQIETLTAEWQNGGKTSRFQIATYARTAP